MLFCLWATETRKRKKNVYDVLGLHQGKRMAMSGNRRPSRTYGLSLHICFALPIWEQASFSFSEHLIENDFFFFFFFFGLFRAAPLVGFKSELQLPASATATATWDPGCIQDLCHTLQQHGILNTLSKSGIEPISLWMLVGLITCWATMGTPENDFLKALKFVDHSTV